MPPTELKRHTIAANHAPPSPASYAALGGIQFGPHPLTLSPSFLFSPSRLLHLYPCGDNDPTT